MTQNAYLDLGEVASEIRSERVDGPRWVEAVREGRRLREGAAPAVFDGGSEFCRYATGEKGPACHHERRGGIPVGWRNLP